MARTREAVEDQPPRAQPAPANLPLDLGRSLLRDDEGVVSGLDDPVVVRVALGLQRVPELREPVHLLVEV